MNFPGKFPISFIHLFILCQCRYMIIFYFSVIFSNSYLFFLFYSKTLKIGDIYLTLVFDAFHIFVLNFMTFDQRKIKIKLSIFKYFS